ncbi:hypothetical protein [Actinomyces sp. oral taxon 171]|nr:hypothetical protein [Actinomyces sp. oral taxon 171]EFW27944.1 hypothetical protein HMPREF9057_00659 [Actinomyces sp. oral taxon 171 str. F0337]
MPEKITFTCPELTAFLSLHALGFRGLIRTGGLKDHLTTTTRTPR